MMLFNDLFIYFVVVFPLLGTSKELIRDFTKAAQFGKTVRESSR